MWTGTGRSWWKCWELSHVSRLTMLFALKKLKKFKKNDSLPSLIPPYRWLSWWLLTRSFLSGPFLPPRRARRLQGGHGKALLPQRGGCYNCSLRVCKPRCPSETKPWRRNVSQNSCFFSFSFLAVSSEKSRSGRKKYEGKVGHVFSTLRLICQWKPSSESLQLSLLIGYD